MAVLSACTDDSASSEPARVAFAQLSTLCSNLQALESVDLRQHNKGQISETLQFQGCPATVPTGPCCTPQCNAHDSHIGALTAPSNPDQSPRRRQRREKTGQGKAGESRPMQAYAREPMTTYGFADDTDTEASSGE
eukprot:CAMPEP_0115594622 /NCGR_PEP_ID=MMETSP0272-20121206/11902_1 /TAXON_ID=71861 /ORGANISM="Scrippsiella trochoidea, Strain CCMP3099" /LENGTH=135 /DNA_ID=CAMNT_0003029909 /DNA_START=306 /DNA_END=712 /DNA_ORIENTATION=+